MFVRITTTTEIFHFKHYHTGGNDNIYKCFTLEAAQIQQEINVTVDMRINFKIKEES